MAHAFKTISAKPTFGTLKENLYQSDYINRKKGTIAFCKSPSGCQNSCLKIRVAPSYDKINLFNLGRYLDRRNLFLNNKTNLVIGQYAKENLIQVCTVSPLSPYMKPTPCGPDAPCNPCQNNNPVIIDPANSTDAFFNIYITDPLGELFGKTQCGELNYTNHTTTDLLA